MASVKRMRHHLPALLTVWFAACVYLSMHATKDWIPHDEGLLAQSAERVLAGELPHRDYDEPYTGGLTSLHALAFRLLGPNLVSLRITLLVAALLAIPVIYYLAVHAVSRWNAALVTAGCVLWSVPNYFASMPSWYNLFLGIAGVAALFRFVETRRWRWVFLAGVCAGCSVLIKIVGLCCWRPCSHTFR
jgi:hypothetical protein